MQCHGRYRVFARSIGFILLLIVFFIGPAHAAGGELRILISGFAPFGGYASNPSDKLVKFIVAGKFQPIPGVALRAVTLPVTYYECWDALRKEIDEFKPDYILSFGFAPGSKAIRLESSARNYDLGGPDNARRRHFGPIITGEPEQYASELPLNAIAKALTEKGIGALISSDAGGYICNHLFFLERRFSAKFPGMRAGFIHVPDWPVAGAKGLRAAVREIIHTLKDKSIKIGVYEYEPLHNDMSGNLNRIKSIVVQAHNRGVTFHLFPEMALSGLMHPSAEKLLAENPELHNNGAAKALTALAAENQSFIALGLVTQTSEALHNSMQIFTSDGLVYTYNKVHLYGSDYDWAQAGDTYPIFNTPFARLGALICHDVVYDESYQSYLENGVDLLVVPTNWIGDNPISLYLGKFSSKFQAILVSDRKGREGNITFKGNTMIIDSHGIYRPEDLGFGVRGIIYLYVDFGAGS
jgi:pyroglutamyl-peptidase